MTLILLILAVVALVLFATVPPARLAEWIRRFGPIVLGGLAVLALLRGSLGLALPLGAAAWGLRRWLNSSAQPFGGGGGSGGGGWGPRPQGPRGAQTGASSVRSAALEMELDHATGAMNGVVLVGRFEGETLDEMPEGDLIALRREIGGDEESLALLDAYLDRRFPRWREAGEADAGAGQGGAPRTGAMDEEEAYQVLGLQPGAAAAEIREAHRRLMKGAHPDQGGSTFLAAKINEAKDVLLRSHT